MYVISARYKYKFQSEYQWGFVAYENNTGVCATGYPTWDKAKNAIEFTTVEEAKKWWKEHFEYLLTSNYDINISTMAICERVHKVVEPYLKSRFREE